ncbi:venom metalloproteinase BumaMPs1-like [Amblyomma americanum]
MEYLGLASVAYFLCLLIASLGAGLPTYQSIVYPELFDERKDEGVRVLKINEDLTLNLEQSSVLHEDFFIRTYRQGVPQHTYYDVEALQEDLSHDKRRLAAVFLSEEDGTLKVEGVVGPNLKIKPIVGAERSENGLHPHMLEAIEDSGSDNVYGKIPDERPMLVSARSSGFDPDKYSVTEVNPELFVVVDSSFQAQFNSTKLMMKYLFIEFNVVNIRYLTVRNPRIKLIFRGVELSDYRQEAQYYTYLSSSAEIDALDSLYKIVKFVGANNETYGAYDMVYFLTGCDMVAIQGGRRESSLSGYAFVASACTHHRQQLGEDTAYSYRGIRIMAHEVGHTLGCPHDGTSIDGYVKAFRPDSTGCPWEQGYIMSYIEEDGRSMQFSSCCNYMVSQMTWSREAACLHRNDSTTKKGFKWPKVVPLPGDILSLNKQCQLTYPTLKKTYYMKELGIRRCIAQCYVPGWQFQASDHHWPMLLIDGTPCDQRKEWGCINGECRLKRKRRNTGASKRQKQS